MPLVTTVPSDLISSIDRALALVEAVGHRPDGLTAVEIAGCCDLRPATVKHYLVTLSYHGYLRRRDDGRYTLGPTIADRTHDLAAQLQTRQATGTPALELADGLDRPAAVVDQLLHHGAEATAGSCACITSGLRPAPTETAPGVDTCGEPRPAGRERAAAIAECVRRHRAGESVSDIAANLGRTPGQVRILLTEGQIQLRPRDSSPPSRAEVGTHRGRRPGLKDAG